MSVQKELNDIEIMNMALEVIRLFNGLTIREGEEILKTAGCLLRQVTRLDIEAPAIAELKQELIHASAQSA